MEIMDDFRRRFLWLGKGWKHSRGVDREILAAIKTSAE